MLLLGAKVKVSSGPHHEKIHHPSLGRMHPTSTHTTNFATVVLIQTCQDR